jgi:hypothetical protein
LFRFGEEYFREPVTTLVRGKEGVSNTIAQFRNTFLLGAVSTAKDRVVFFDSMTNDVGAATRAGRGKSLNGTFETIECMAGAIHGYLERLVIIITASFAFRHGVPLIKLIFHFLAGHLGFWCILPACHAKIPATAVPFKLPRQNRDCALVAQPQLDPEAFSDLVGDFSAHRGEALLSLSFRHRHWLRGQLKDRCLLTATQLCQKNNTPIRKFERIMVSPLLVLIYLPEDCGRVS